MKVFLTIFLAAVLCGCVTSGEVQPLGKGQRIDVPTPTQSKELEMFVMWEAVGFVPLVGLIPMAEREDAAAKVESALHEQGFDFIDAFHTHLVSELSRKGLDSRLTKRDVKKKLIPTFPPIAELSYTEGASLVLDAKVMWYGFYAHTGGADYLPAVAVQYRLVDVKKQVELWKRALNYNWPGRDAFGVVGLQEKPLKAWPNRDALVEDILGAKADLENTAMSISKAIVDQLASP